jgi:hypothetical protein
MDERDGQNKQYKSIDCASNETSHQTVSKPHSRTRVRDRHPASLETETLNLSLMALIMYCIIFPSDFATWRTTITG